MAKTKFESPEDKLRLQERALALKPKQLGVIATELGWAVPQARGTLELLVSFKNLDELLGDAQSEVEQVGEPIVIAPEAVIEVPPAPVPEAPAPVVEEVKAPEVPVAPAPKKPGPKTKAQKEAEAAAAKAAAEVAEAPKAE